MTVVLSTVLKAMGTYYETCATVIEVFCPGYLCVDNHSVSFLSFSLSLFFCLLHPNQVSTPQLSAALA